MAESSPYPSFYVPDDDTVYLATGRGRRSARRS
jgi:hypothetical protein